MSRYDDILARLRAATGPDRGTDGYIAYALGWRFNGLPDGIEHPLFAKWPGIGGHWHQPGSAFCRVDQSFDPDIWPEPPEWMSSVDAALALVAAQFRHRTWSLSNGPGKFTFLLGGHLGSAPTAPIAILIAHFEALKAKKDLVNGGIL